MTRTVTILGSTGSIGVSTLSLFEESGADIEILALTAGRNVGKLAEQAPPWRWPTRRAWSAPVPP